MELLDQVKTALRTMTDDEGINTQITNLIDAAVIDLTKANIKVDESDPIIVTAIICYVKAYFLVAEYENYFSMYSSIKTHLALLGDYGG